MTDTTKADDEEELSRFLGYYSLEVLSSYRSQPDRYDLQSDNFEGKLRLTSIDAERVDVDGRRAEMAIDVRFGYRTLECGDLAVAAFLPDLHRKSSGHLKRWEGFRLDDRRWAPPPDERFSRWVRRHLEGSWDIENGPRYHLAKAVRRINGLTTEAVGLPLFTSERADPPSFPLAQNTHRYQEAHQELYGYLIDGLSKDTITAIAEMLGKQVELSSDRTIKSLKRVVDEAKCPAFFSALKKTSDERGKATHGTRAPAERFPAFEEFEKDLSDSVAGLTELTRALETLFGLDAKNSFERSEAKRWLRRVVRPAEAHYGIYRIREAIGKTIERVECGYGEPREGHHQTEAIILHFSDGSILGIDTTSNALEICDKGSSLSPEDLRVDFDLNWVPRTATPRGRSGEDDLI